MKYKFTFKKLNKKETLVLDNNYSGLNVSDYNLGIFDNIDFFAGKNSFALGILNVF